MYRTSKQERERREWCWLAINYSRFHLIHSTLTNSPTLCHINRNETFGKIIINFFFRYIFLIIIDSIVLLQPIIAISSNRLHRFLSYSLRMFRVRMTFNVSFLLFFFFWLSKSRFDWIWFDSPLISRYGFAMTALIVSRWLKFPENWFFDTNYFFLVFVRFQSKIFSAKNGYLFLSFWNKFTTIADWLELDVWEKVSKKKKKITTTFFVFKFAILSLQV